MQHERKYHIGLQYKKHQEIQRHYVEKNKAVCEAKVKIYTF